MISYNILANVIQTKRCKVDEYNRINISDQQQGQKRKGKNTSNLKS